MAHAQAQTKRASARRSAKAAIALPIEDPQKDKNTCKDFGKTRQQDRSDRKATLVERLCAELTAHAQVEGEMFHPSVRAAIADDDRMDGSVDRAGARA